MANSVSSPELYGGCPSTDELRAFATSALSHASMDAIEVHVSRCESCLSALDSWDEDSDELLQALASLPSGPDDELAFQQLQATLFAQREPIALADLPTASFPARTSVRSGSAPDVPEQIGGYELLELIGRGASGAVYRARHMKLDRIVAIKVLNAAYMGDDQQVVARFQQEMRAVGQLDHPHIVRATDAGEDRGRHFLVMDYVDGIDVSRLLRLTGPLRVADACEIVRQAALALQFAHDHQMVHRDVKPSNLLFALSGEVKLLDLGLARDDSPGSRGGAAWQTSIPHGTADYMSPEQWTDFAAVDARADVYSLGCTLFKLLAGRPVYPRSRQDYAAKMDAHLAERVPHVRQHRPEVPLGLQKILSRMLAKRPGDRYETAAEVATRLEPYVQGSRLPELGARLGETPREMLAALPTEDTSVRGPRARLRRIPRRAWLAACATLVPGALLLTWLWPRRAPQLRTGTWRDLRPLESPIVFHGAKSVSSLTAAEESLTRPDLPLKLIALDDTLWSLGQPAQGPFTIRADWIHEPNLDRLGLFFKYRPQKSAAGITHPFQAIELARLDTGEYRLLWSRYHFLEIESGVFQRDYTPWAEVPVQFSTPTNSTAIEIELGRTGFPLVHWNGERLSEGRWTLSWQARQMSQLTSAELRHAYLGQIGIFARAASATFSRLQLSYLNEQETT